MSYAQVSILNAENLEWHFPEKFEEMERGNLTRRKTGSGHIIISTGYLIVTPENQITSTVIVSPAIGSVNAGFDSLEARLKEEFPNLIKLGNKTQSKIIHGKVFETVEAAFQVIDHIFGSEQKTFLFIILHKQDDEIIQIKASSPIDEWNTTPMKMRALLNRIVSRQQSKQ